jgi:hypothetical protein
MSPQTEAWIAVRDPARSIVPLRTIGRENGVRSPCRLLSPRRTPANLAATQTIPATVAEIAQSNAIGAKLLIC